MTTENKASEISPLELKGRLDAGDPVTLLDVREAHELEIAVINAPNTVHIRMPELAEKFSELNNYKEGDLVVYCRSGGRSARCAAFLQEQGFKNVFNLTGGILSWADQVDPSLTKY